MDKIISAGSYHGEIVAPTSKSYLQRAIAIASLSPTPCTIQGYTPSDDVQAALSVAQALGASVTQHADSLTIQKRYAPLTTPLVLHCGESGLCARMFSVLAALQPIPITITAEGSLLTRPFNMVVNALQQLGKTVNSNHQHLPLHLEGELQATTLRIDGSESSQLLTGLLIALPTLPQNTTIHVQNLRSIPYVDITLAMLKHFGIHITHHQYHTFHIPANQIPYAPSYIPEGDWSGAAFHLVAAAISGSASIHNLNTTSVQGDSQIYHILAQCGAHLQTAQNTVSVQKAPLRAFRADATHTPDLFPPLAALAACCNGTSQIQGTNRLLHKESNRASALLHILHTLGVPAHIHQNTLFITGGSPLRGGVTLPSYNDHRIAMTAAILALVAPQPITINDAQVVSKSYPHFFEHFYQLKKNI